MSDYGSTLEIEMITELSRLQEKLQYWEKLPFIALDTEFVRVDTFYPKPGLIQIADDVGIYLIDPVEITDLSVLKPLLVGDTIKVMHSMSEDVVLFQTVADCIPENIFDTQIACALLGEGISVGYQKFIERYLGLVIDKGETRSDWLRRPLSDSQIEYAAKDVEYLYEVYPRIQQLLTDKGLSQVVQQECTLINKGVLETNSDIGNYYLKFRGAWKYPLNSQAMLKKMTIWREREARQRDKPRGRIISDKQLSEIVELLPKSINALQATNILKPMQLRKYGEYVVSVITELLDASPDLKRIPRALSGRKLDFYRTLKKAVDVIAVENNIASELLGRKRLLEMYIRNAYAQHNVGGTVSLPEEFGDWRIKLLETTFKTMTESNFNEQ